jgi:hypothetical protein
MNRLYILLIIILVPAQSYAQNYQIDWFVIGSGGGSG